MVQILGNFGKVYSEQLWNYVGKTFFISKSATIHNDQINYWGVFLIIRFFTALIKSCFCFGFMILVFDYWNMSYHIYIQKIVGDNFLPFATPEIPKLLFKFSFTFWYK